MLSLLPQCPAAHVNHSSHCSIDGPHGLAAVATADGASPYQTSFPTRSG
ncbi:MAG TPA: hypothetical protein VH650_00085 [Gaiellaceae bacterium]